MTIRIQCASCQRVLQAPDSASGKKVRCPGCQAVIPVTPTSNSASPVAPSPSAQRPTPRPSGPVSTDDKIPVQCPSCGKNLRAPATAAGKAIRCPGCQSAISVPLPGGASLPRPAPVNSPFPGTPAPSQATTPSANPFNNDALWASIPNPSTTSSSSYGGSGGYSNPYAAPATSYSGGSSGRGGSPTTQYSVVGVFMMILSGLLVLGCIVRPIMLAFVLMNLPDNATVDWGKLTPLLIGTAIGIVVGLIMAGIYLKGGYAFFYQTDYAAAKSAAILMAIPCCGSCFFPIGIWACVLIFSNRAKKDFDS